MTVFDVILFEVLNRNLKQLLNSKNTKRTENSHNKQEECDTTPPSGQVSSLSLTSAVVLLVDEMQREFVLVRADSMADTALPRTVETVKRGV